MSEDTTIANTVTTIDAQLSEIESLQRQLNESVASLTEMTRLRDVQRSNSEYWEKKFRAAETDWNTLNESLNEYADENDMCSEYEDKISEWNADFGVLTLTGRSREYEVEVTVTATYTHKVTVTAVSAEDAVDRVNNNYDDADVTEGISWPYYDDLSWETTGDADVA